MPQRPGLIWMTSLKWCAGDTVLCHLNVCHTVSTLTPLIKLPFDCPDITYFGAQPEMKFVTYRPRTLQRAAWSRLSRSDRSNGWMLINGQRRRNLDKNVLQAYFTHHEFHISHVVSKQRLRVRCQRLSELRLVSNTHQIWYKICIFFSLVAVKSTLLPWHRPVG
jgi:hypothetical protein